MTPDSSSYLHRRRKCERRYHIHPVALGSDSVDCDLPPARTTSRSKISLEIDSVIDTDLETLSDQHIIWQLPIRGLRFCAWVLVAALVYICFKQIITIAVMAFCAWLNLN